MWNWLRRKLGIIALEEQQERASKAIRRIEKNTGVIKPSQRYDEIERARSRRRKAGNAPRYCRASPHSPETDSTLRRDVPMNKKPYMINETPVTARELMNEAAAIDLRFNNDCLKSTSRAATILREVGYTVTDNPKEKQSCGV